MTNIDRIKELAKEKGLSLAFLCEKMGVTRVYFIDFVRRGRKDIPIDKLRIIANTLNTTVAYLQNETDEKNAATDNGNSVKFDDFTYALHNATRDLTDADKQLLLDMAERLRSIKGKSNGVMSIEK